MHVLPSVESNGRKEFQKESSELRMSGGPLTTIPLPLIEKNVNTHNNTGTTINHNNIGTTINHHNEQTEKSRRNGSHGRSKSCGSLRNRSEYESLNQVACLKVDVLYPGDTLGLGSLFEECKDSRKFSLVSSGCEILRVPLNVLAKITDPLTLEGIQNSVRAYPPDKDLIKEFKALSEWMGFRKNVVNQVLHK